MDFKKIRVAVSRFAGWIGLNVVSAITRCIPARYLYGFANGIGTLGYHLAARQRKIALESLAVAFGNEKTDGQIKEIARECFRRMAKSGVELSFLIDKPELLRQRVRFKGLEVLDRALERGKGVILVSAHFGNFPLLLARLAQAGYKTSGIMRPMRDSRVEQLFLKQRARYNIRTIYSQPRNVCVNSTIEALRNNEAVFIPIDQNFGTAGVFVDFFGRKAATATGPVILAQRTKAALLPCFIVRHPDNTHEILFDEPITLVEGADSRETILLNVQKLTHVIELYIRQYPAEWGWLHRRWKSVPQQAAS